MSRHGNSSDVLFLEFLEDSPVVDPQGWDLSPADLDRWKHHAELMLESDEPWVRLDGRRGLTTHCIVRLKALLAGRTGLIDRTAATEASQRLESLRGRVAEPAELEDLVACLARAMGSNRDRVGGTGESWSERYPDLMASEFAPELVRMRELREDIE